MQEAFFEMVWRNHKMWILIVGREPHFYHILYELFFMMSKLGPTFWGWSNTINPPRYSSGFNMVCRFEVRCPFNTPLISKIALFERNIVSRPSFLVSKFKLWRCNWFFHGCVATLSGSIGSFLVGNLEDKTQRHTHMLLHHPLPTLTQPMAKL